MTGVPAAVADSVIVTVRKPERRRRGRAGRADARARRAGFAGRHGAQPERHRRQLRPRGARHAGGLVDDHAADGLPRPVRRARRLLRAGGGAATASAAQPGGRGARVADRGRGGSRAREEDAGAADGNASRSSPTSRSRASCARRSRAAGAAPSSRSRCATSPTPRSTIVVAALDNEDACRFDFDKQQLSAEPGRRDGTPFRVQAAQADDLRAHQGAPLHASTRRPSAATSRPARSPPCTGSGRGSRPGCSRSSRS